MEGLRLALKNLGQKMKKRVGKTAAMAKKGSKIRSRMTTKKLRKAVSRNLLRVHSCKFQKREDSKIRMREI